ncbi:MAG: TonB-dependent receptor plug domain-containing protein, partial [Sedimentisphaerales bacterium]
MFILKNLSPRLFVLVLIFLFVFAFNAQLFARQQDVNQPEDFFEMPLEELMDVEIESPATLTKTKQQFVPATVTTITKQDIQRSGARSLYELLEARVPNFQMIFHIAKLRHLGLRGIISNRDDKFLLLVNGRVMNEKTDFGVMTERDLPMLSDIHHIDVVRGPGSALYGPGALAMVINIVTEDATTFQGTQVTGRLGAIEEFYSGEFKYGKKFKDDSGIFIYGGATKYPGADLDYSPIVPGGTHTFSGITHTAGDEIDMWFNNFNESFRGLGKYKFHGQYTKGGLNIWARYTSGGEYIDFIRIKKKKLWPHEGEGYRQGTIYVGYDHSFSDNFSIKTAFSYDRTEVETRDGVYRIKSFREEEYYSKVVANLTPNESHSLAVGGEWSHELFGRRHSNDQGKAVMYLLPYNSRKTFDEAT